MLIQIINNIENLTVKNFLQFNKYMLTYESFNDKKYTPLNKS